MSGLSGIDGVFSMLEWLKIPDEVQVVGGGHVGTTIELATDGRVIESSSSCSVNNSDCVGWTMRSRHRTEVWIDIEIKANRSNWVGVVGCVVGWVGIVEVIVVVITEMVQHD